MNTRSPMNIFNRFKGWRESVHDVCDAGVPLNGPALLKFLDDAERELMQALAEIERLKKNKSRTPMLSRDQLMKHLILAMGVTGHERPSEHAAHTLHA